MLDTTKKLFLTEQEENGKKKVTIVINTETRWKYVVLSLVFGFTLNTVKNAVHELSHVALILLLGGRIDSVSISFNIGFVRWAENSIPAWSSSLVYMAGIAGEFLFIFLPGIVIFMHNRGHVLIALIGYWMIILFILALFYWCGGAFYAGIMFYDPIGFSIGIGVNPAIVGLVSLPLLLLDIRFAIRCTRELRARFLHDKDKVHIYTVISVLFVILLFLKLFIQSF